MTYSQKHFPSSSARSKSLLNSRLFCLRANLQSLEGRDLNEALAGVRTRAMAFAAAVTRTVRRAGAYE